MRIEKIEPFNFKRTAMMFTLGFIVMLINSIFDFDVTESVIISVMNIGIFGFCIYNLRNYINEYTSSANKSLIEFKLVNEQAKKNNVGIEGSLEKMFKEYDENLIASKTNLFGVITYASKAYQNMSGYTEEELLGQPHNIIRHPDMPKEAFKQMWETIKNDETWTGEVKNFKKDGTFYWVEAKITPIYDEQGIKVGYTAVRHDITREKVWELNHASNRRFSDRRVNQRRGNSIDYTGIERRTLADRRINTPTIVIEDDGRAGFISSESLGIKKEK